MSNIPIIIQREFNERVRKKSFIISTLLMPLLMVALMVAPALIMLFAEGDEKHIDVIDRSGLVAGHLTDAENVAFVTVTDSLDEARTRTESFGVLYIPEDVIAQPQKVTLYANGPTSMPLEEAIRGQIAKLIETEKLKSYNIESLDTILREVKTSVPMKVIRNDKSEEEGEESFSSAAASAAGYILGFMLYMFLIIYGSMVMQAVIEEKNSRVLDVLATTVKPFDLMMGKILGIASVAVVQVLIWGLLLVGISAFVMPSILPPDVMAGAQAIQQGGMPAAEMSGLDPDMLQAVAVVSNWQYIVMLIFYTLLFFIGGYLLYSAMFAAVGSAVDNVQDAAQLQTPITLPIILSIMVLFVVMKDPNSSLSFWFSIIPFTSPVVMLARIPYEIPTWEIILSLAVLYGTFTVMVWLSAKIYRVGILMHGKKPSLKELLSWIKEA